MWCKHEEVRRDNRSIHKNRGKQRCEIHSELLKNTFEIKEFSSFQVNWENEHLKKVGKLTSQNVSHKIAKVRMTFQIICRISSKEIDSIFKGNCWNEWMIGIFRLSGRVASTSVGICALLVQFFELPSADLSSAWRMNASNNTVLIRRRVSRT